MIKNPKLPEYVHIVSMLFDYWDNNDMEVNSKKTFKIPSKWLKFNGQENGIQWSWKVKYIKEVEDALGEWYRGEIHVIEWNIIQDVAYLMKSCKELGFDVMSYYTQLKDKDIKYFNARYISI